MDQGPVPSRQIAQGKKHRQNRRRLVVPVNAGGRHRRRWRRHPAFANPGHPGEKPTQNSRQPRADAQALGWAPSIVQIGIVMQAIKCDKGARKTFAIHSEQLGRVPSLMTGASGQWLDHEKPRRRWGHPLLLAAGRFTRCEDHSRSLLNRNTSLAPSFGRTLVISRTGAYASALRLNKRLWVYMLPLS